VSSVVAPESLGVVFLILFAFSDAVLVSVVSMFPAGGMSDLFPLSPVDFLFAVSVPVVAASPVDTHHSLHAVLVALVLAAVAFPVGVFLLVFALSVALVSVASVSVASVPQADGRFADFPVVANKIPVKLMTHWNPQLPIA